jgi:hypothetical protein
MTDKKIMEYSDSTLESIKKKENLNNDLENQLKYKKIQNAPTKDFDVKKKLRQLQGIILIIID